MRNTLTIYGDGCVIRGTPTPWDRWGLFVEKGGFNGWGGIADRRRDQVARAVEHGEHDVRVYLGARVMTVTGWILAPTLEQLREFSHQLAGVGGDGQRVRWAIDHQGQTLHALGRTLVARPDDKGVRRRDHYRARFELQVVFSDPRKYGPSERFPTVGYGTLNDVFQRGNFPAHPVIEFGSGPSGWSCQAPGRLLEVSDVPTGGVQRFDMRTGRITRNGVDVTDEATITGDLWAVPRGRTWHHALSLPGRILLPETYI